MIILKLMKALIQISVGTVAFVTFNIFFLGVMIKEIAFRYKIWWWLLILAADVGAVMLAFEVLFKVFK